MTYNLALFLILVTLVIVLAKTRVELTEQSHELEELLRDWTQETAAQLTLLTNESLSDTTFQVQGIYPDAEDIEVAEDFDSIDVDLK